MDFDSRLQGWTRQRLADYCGVSKQWIIQVLKHGATPSFPLAKRLQEASGGAIRWTEFFDQAA